jgi:glycosyltransferase involved in cell wall biosynthesis
VAATRHVVILRGSMVNPWDLRPWELLGDGYDVSVLVPHRNQYETGGLDLARVPIRTVGDHVPPGKAGRLLVRAIGERYLSLEPQLRAADIVHAAELGFWFTHQAARLRERLGFRLVATVWETLPFLDAYRNVRTRRYRRDVLSRADLFLATTQRAAVALALEGAPDDRIRVCSPGVDLDRFGAARIPAPPGDGKHLILSAGRLVWEKGHQDVLRAVALLRRRGRDDIRVLMVGNGPEEQRLRAVVDDLGLADIVELRAAVPYDEMPGLYAGASCLVLASLPTAFWEEQFGMVLAEAMAAHLAVVATRSGAIPEVVGEDAELFAPGDWVGLADVLERGPLSAAPGTRRPVGPERIERFGAAAAAARLRAAYEDLPPR